MVNKSLTPCRRRRAECRLNSFQGYNALSATAVPAMYTECTDVLSHGRKEWGILPPAKEQTLFCYGDGRLSGKMVASVGWSLVSGLDNTIDISGHEVTKAWSKDGRLASGSGDGKIRIYTNNSEFITLSVNGPVTSVAWSPDGRRLASASSDCTIYICDPYSGTTCKLSGHTEDNPLCTCRRSFSFEIEECMSKYNWVSRGVSSSCTERGHSRSVTSIAWMRNDVLVSGSDDTTVKIWNTNEAQCTQRRKGLYCTGLTSVELYRVAPSLYAVGTPLGCRSFGSS